MPAGARLICVAATSRGRLNPPLLMKPKLASIIVALIACSTAFAAMPSVYTSRPAGEFLLFDIAWYRGAFYGAADGGKIFVSPDGIQWKGIQTPVVDRLESIATTSAGLIVGRKRGGILFSSDGVEWIDHGELPGMAASSGELFVSGDYISLDGMNWYSSITGEQFLGEGALPEPDPQVFTISGQDAYLGSPGYARTAIHISSQDWPAMKVFALGSVYLGLDNGKVYRSGDLEEWVEVEGIALPPNGLISVGDAAFAASGEVKLATRDGAEWTDLSHLHLSPEIAFAEGVFYGLGSDGEELPTHVWLKSSDGLSWSAMDVSTPDAGSGYTINEIAASPDGIAAMLHRDAARSYTFIQEGAPAHEILFAPSGASEIHLVGEDPVFAVSDSEAFRLDSDGAWRKPESWRGGPTVFANDRFLSALDGELQISSDGANWQPVDAPDGYAENYGNFAIHSESGAAFWIRDWDAGLARSEDGLVWEQKTLPTNETEIESIFRFKGNVYLENGDSQQPGLYRSQNDGGSWTLAVTLSPQATVATTGARIGILRPDESGEPDALAFDVSTDGAAWTERAIPETTELELVATDDAFFLLGKSVWTSADGVAWTELLPHELRAASNGKRIVFYLDTIAFVELATIDLELSGLEAGEDSFRSGSDAAATVRLANRGDQPVAIPPGSTIRFVLSQRPRAWSPESLEEDAAFSASVPAVTLASGEFLDIATEHRLPRDLPSGDYFLAASFWSGATLKDGNASNDFAFSDSAEVAIALGQTYDQWAAIHLSDEGPGRDPFDDFDSDGDPNVAEYIFGAPFSSQASAYPIGVRIEDGDLVSVYALYNQANGFDFEAVFTRDGVEWSTAGIETKLIGSEQDLEIYESRSPLDESTEPLLLAVRIRFSQ